MRLPEEMSHMYIERIVPNYSYLVFTVSDRIFSREHDKRLSSDLKKVGQLSPDIASQQLQSSKATIQQA
jgi:hypothetical protein